jgi:hypothetical protein
MSKTAQKKEVLVKKLNQLGDALDFCTLETGVFGLIAEGQQLLVRIR